MMTSSRLPTRISRGQPTSDGAGVRLTRLMGGDPRMPSVDPFLMLDYFDSPDASDYLAGFPSHPHRGFETVTYMLDGRMRHKDNHGHEGLIETGGVQWMTAGRGVIHSEMPEQTSGLMRGFQLWVNLPATLKMQAPAYQEHPAASMPVEKRDGVDVKVIAGATSRGMKGPVTVEPTSAIYFDLTLTDGATFEEPLDPSFAGVVVVHGGAIGFADGREVASLGIAELGQGDTVRFTARGAARVLLIAGKPLREPVAWHGPFVMNTRAELAQAFEDYQAGRF
ncbi:MAG: pirin family protein [Betaproteobacteria bacterium]